MRATQATAGVPTRPAAILLTILALGCGGGTEPPDPGAVGARGLWNAALTTSGQLPGGQRVTCTIAWAMMIDDPGGPDLATYTPLSTRFVCDNGLDEFWQYRGMSLLVRQDGSTVAFLTASRLDTFAVTTLSGTRMTGKTGAYFYPGSAFSATRRSGSDPNLQVSLVDVYIDSLGLEVGDTLTFAVQVTDGYGRPLDDRPAWSSSAPAHATVDANGVASAVSPGPATLVAQVASVRDSVTVTVLPPAASVEILSAPDSMIAVQLYGISAVAKDAGGQPLYDRRITWTSSDTTIAKVDGGGGIETFVPGTVTITARCGPVSASRTFTVLPAVAQLTLASPGTVVTLGGTLQVTATARDAQGNVLTGRPIAWDAGDGVVIAANQSGLLTGITAGSIVLTATVENASATLTVSSVMDAPLAVLAAGSVHTCGVSTTGSAYCWGLNDVGQLGAPVPDALGASRVSSGEHFTSVASGGPHTCALNQAGAASCWGLNSFGQLGGTPASTSAVVAVVGGHAFTRLAAGEAYTCGLESGAAWCWGLNGSGQLGRGTDDLLTNTAPAAVVGGHTFTAVAAGSATACGRTSAGAVWCWGSNLTGNLGLGTADGGPHGTPVHAAPALTFTAIAPGRDRTCGITTGTAEVVCWGGAGADLDPAPMAGTGGTVELAAGDNNFCRVSGGGTVSCWGEWDLSPLPTAAVSGVKVGGRHACAILTASGRTVCWGWDDSGQLGTARTLPPPAEPLGQP